MGEAWAAWRAPGGNPDRFRTSASPREFLEHASRSQIVDVVGLDASSIAAAALAILGDR